MKRNLYALLLVFATCTVCFGLTPAERKIVEHARTSLLQAQAEGKKQADMAAWADQEQKTAWDFAATQKTQIDQLQKDIKTSHDNEQTMANAVQKMKKVYDAVTRWWSLGAFVWGVQQLIKHLLILAIFGTVLMLVFWGLTFVFPFLLPAFRIALIPFNWLLAHIEARISARK